MVGLAIFCHPADTLHVELDHASARIFVRTLIYSRKICSARKISYGMIRHFKTVCLSSIFFLVCLAIVHHPADTFHVELDCASACIFVHTLIFTFVCVIIFSDHVHDRTNNLSIFHFSVSLAIICHPADMFHVELDHASVRIFV